VTAWRGTHRESAWGQESQKAAALDAGADDYVTKPRPKYLLTEASSGYRFIP